MPSEKENCSANVLMSIQQVMMTYISICQFSEEVEAPEQVVEESCNTTKNLNVEAESKRYFVFCAFAFENLFSFFM